MPVYFGKKLVNCQIKTGDSGGSVPEPAYNPALAEANYEQVKALVRYGQTKLTTTLAENEHGFIGIRYNYSDYDTTETFTINSDVTKVVTSDGATYTTTSTHTWDATNGVSVGDNNIRWVIYYTSGTSYQATSSVFDISKAVNIVYVCAVNMTYMQNGGCLTRTNRVVEGLDFIRNYSLTINGNYAFAGCTRLAWYPEKVTYSNNTLYGNQFCSGCPRLYKLPVLPVLKTNDSCYSMFQGCYSLVEIPSNIDWSVTTSMQSAFQDCDSLAKLPSGMNTSKVTNFSRFCYGARSLTEVPSDLDTSAGTNFQNFCYNSGVKKIPALNMSKGTDFSNFAGNSRLETLGSIDTSRATTLANFCTNTYITEIPAAVTAVNATAINNFCQNCYRLETIPDTFVVTSKCTNMTNFCNSCYALRKLSDNIDCTGTTNLTNFCYFCYSLESIPSGMTFSTVQNFSSCFRACTTLMKIDNIIDMSAATNTSQFIIDTYGIRYCKIKLPASANLILSYNPFLSVESLKYLSDNAPTVSGKTLTLGTDNISRANAADSTIITTLTTKGWTVN